MSKKQKTVLFSFINPNTKKPLTKQWEFYKTCMLAAAGKTKERFIYFGGGVNSGKTYTALFTLMELAQKYPRTKWYVIRQSLPALISTTVESATKLFVACKGRWIRDKSNYRYQFDNGSVIVFFSENYDADKDLFRFRGLEYNGVLLEEANELQPETFYKAIERNGRWKCNSVKTPEPIVMCTYNPSPHEFWRQLFYYPVKNNEIPENTKIIMATAADNPFITKGEMEMFATLENLDSLHYDMFINGNWDAFENVKAWAYSFDKRKHVGTVKMEEDKQIVLSFDFNVDPIVCLLAHVDVKQKSLKVFKEFKLRNSNIYELCGEIKKYLKVKRNIIITGDASGKNRNIAIRENASAYSIILKELDLPKGALNGIPSKNLALRDSRIVVNGVLEHFDVKIDSNCKELIKDLMLVEVEGDGKINKTQNKELTHLFDAFRYICNSFFTPLIIK